MGEIRRVKVTCPLAGETHKEKWVERRETIGVPVYRELNELGIDYLTSEEALERICVIFSEQILDWNLEDDTGKALPKPYRKPKALEKLAEVDFDAFLWVSKVVQFSIDQLVEPEEEK